MRVKPADDTDHRTGTNEGNDFNLINVDADGVGDILIIASYATYNEIELASFEPTLVYVGENNRIKRVGAQIPAQAA